MSPVTKTQLVERLGGQGLDMEDWGDSVFLYGGNGALSENSVDLAGYEVIRRLGNLEDVFLRLTGRGLREE